MWPPIKLGYSLGTYCGIQIFSDICLRQFFDIRSSLGRSHQFQALTPPCILDILEETQNYLKTFGL